jgi:hypothetical protein
LALVLIHPDRVGELHIGIGVPHHLGNVFGGNVFLWDQLKRVRRSVSQFARGVPAASHAG